MTFKQKLNRMINGRSTVTVFSEEIRQLMTLERIKAKAQAYIENNPKPRAVFH